MKPIEYVLIIARRAETLDGLRAYLDRLGVPSRCSRTLDALGRAAPGSMKALVLFPDDLPGDDVLAALSALRRDGPGARTVVVTRSPDRFRAASVDVVLPRPAFGWDILDAVLGRAPTMT